MVRKSLLILGIFISLLFSGCSESTEAADQTYRENPLFAKLTEPILGLNVLELQELIGPPTTIIRSDCEVGTAGNDGKLTMHTGDEWIYIQSIAESLMELEVCVLEGYVVMETHTWTIFDGAVLSISIDVLSDTEITDKVINGKMGISRKERTSLAHPEKIKI